MLWNHPARVVNLTQSFYEVGSDLDKNLLTIFHQSMPLDKIQNKLADKIVIKDPELLEEIVKTAS